MWVKRPAKAKQGREGGKGEQGQPQGGEKRSEGGGAEGNMEVDRLEVVPAGEWQDFVCRCRRNGGFRLAGSGLGSTVSAGKGGEPVGRSMSYKIV